MSLLGWASSKALGTVEIGVIGPEKSRVNRGCSGRGVFCSDGMDPGPKADKACNLHITAVSTQSCLTLPLTLHLLAERSLMPGIPWYLRQACGDLPYITLCQRNASH